MQFHPRIHWAQWTWAARLALAAGLAVCLCGSAVLGWMQVRSMAKRRVYQQISLLGKKLGTPVLVGKIDVTVLPFLISLEDIRLGPDAQVAISRIEAEVNLKPFSTPFVEIDEISIERLELKMTEDRLKSLVAAPAGNDPVAPPPLPLTAPLPSSLQQAVDKLFASLPSRHTIVYGAQITLLNPQGEPTVQVQDLKLAVDKPSSEVIFRVARLKTLSGLNEAHVYGRLELSATAPDYRFFIKSKASANAKARIWSSSGSVQKDLNQIQFNIAFHRRPSFLAALLKDQPLEVTRLRSRLQVELTKGLGGWQYTAQIQSLGSTLRLPLVSSRELGPLFFEVRANGSYQPNTRALIVDAAMLTLPSRISRAYGDSPVRLTGRLQATIPPASSDSGQRNITARGQINLPMTSCQSLIEASPGGLLPLLEDFKLAGDTAATLEFDLQSKNLEASHFSLQDASFDCSVRESPYAFTAEHLNGPLAVERQVEAEGPPLTVSLDKLAPSFAAFPSIGKNAQAAFVSSEDAAFYLHKGIDASALVSALRRDLAEGRVAVGGSTITMQTVKNLFLTPERTLTRKMQELFLAWHLERTLTKERILELYMNVAELGPGIYGIGQASEHFFGKPPFDLTLLESAYLATLLPSPKVRYRYFCKGDLTPNYRELVRGLLRRMLTLGRISNDRYQQALNSTLHFNEEQRLASKDCNLPPGPAAADAPDSRPESAYLLRRPGASSE